MTKKIKDNESIQPLLNLLKIGETSFSIIDKIPFIYKFTPQIKSFKEQFKKIQNQSYILNLPDQFNELFSKDGWICYGSLSTKILEETVRLGHEKRFNEAHLLLIDSIDEITIDLILLRCECRKHFDLRIPLLQLLKNDYLEERYHACIPLLLALIDGLANDISAHVGFFAGKTDLELFDSITSHESGLPFLQTIMNKTRKTTTNEKITIPYRNGILHGRDLNFNNKEVASKCWWALACLLEWADEKQLNKQPKEQVSFFDTLKTSNDIHEYSKRIDKWEKRSIKTKNYWEIQALKTLDENSPEHCLLTFLENWKNKRWGLMNNMLVHTINNERATIKRLKEDYLPIQIHHFSILTSTDQTPAITDITVQLNYTKNQENFHQTYIVQMNSLDDEGNLYLRNEKDSKWYILQTSFTEVLF
ncbi:hypothetical protein [Acinetobacter sp. Marseille-Q1623]|uniref:hypothetical protein n=1 Tax=Acinetobacter sp. Marseille-Q1623 TaxID=2697501 RepID=UPI00157B53B4|nr:hypothetical protein [Acinetobacter sp. Marseille-Q1623]